ncbi:MAG TPA: hypothetical protein VHB21_26270, partial [Minicystis sp.]|nr:hypothetical protein [Minicystis sp.]
AALEQEEDRARDRAAELAAQMRALSADLERANERLDRDLLVVTARLEGRIAALRSIALEAALALEHVAAELGLGPSDVWTPPAA